MATDTSKESQVKAIIAHLSNRGNTITALNALQMFGCFRLASRIWDIKQRGIDVRDRYIETENGKRIKQYWIAGHEMCS